MMRWEVIVLVVWFGGTLVVGQGLLYDVNPCDPNYLGVSLEACEPCDSSNWNYMVYCLNESFFSYKSVCDGEPIIDNSNIEPTAQPISGCYNDNPVADKYTKEVEVLIAKGVPDLKLQEAALGFNIPELPFFRYFLPPSARKNSEYEKFDIGQVKDLYVGNGEDTDFELLEWPGRSSSQLKDHLDSVSVKNYGCPGQKKIEIPNTVPQQYRCEDSHHFTMLHYDGETSKFWNYKCNKQLGTSIVAYGQAQETQNSTGHSLDKDLNDINNDPIQKIWLSHGSQSIHRKYTQPILVRKATLDRLVAPKGQDGCQPDEVDLVLKQRTVYDFAFVTDGIVLGMHCGIVILKNLQEKVFVDYVPTLTTRNGRGTAFPEPINKLSSSVCCDATSVCNKETHIVAAYSYEYNTLHTVEEDSHSFKFLYVSFDSGATFEQKFIADEVQNYNLIDSMYNIYERFAYYYELLGRKELYEEVPDLKRSQQSELWDSLNPEEREAEIFSHIRTTKEAGDNKQKLADSLGHLFCKQTLNISKNFTPGLRNYKPKWLLSLIKHRYRKYYKADGYKVSSHQECLDTPECQQNIQDTFEEDRVTKEILKSFGPLTGVRQEEECDKAETEFDWKRKKNLVIPKEIEAKCTEIASVVIVEEDQDVLVLCKMRFCEGDCNNPLNFNSTNSSGRKKLRDNVYKVFYLSPRVGIPITPIYEWGAKYFECDLIKYELGGDKQGFYIQPELIRIPDSPAYVIRNCKNALYYTVDSGKSIFSFVFYTKKIVKGNNTSNGTGQSNGTYSSTIFAEKRVTEDTQWIRTYRPVELDVAPSVAVSKDGYRVLMTFKNFYAYGQISFKQTSIMRVGIAFEKPTSRNTIVGQLIPEETVAVPWFKNSGNPAISISLLGLFNRVEADITTGYRPFYKDRHAIRLVEIPVSFFTNEAAFYSENRKVTKEALDGDLSFGGCTTFNFKYGPPRVNMDLRETAKFTVSVTDKDPYLSLGVFTGSDTSVHVQVEKENSGAEDDVRLHNWEVKITSIPNKHYEPEIEAFYGSRYEPSSQYQPTAVLLAKTNSRCHVQPLGQVRIGLGCNGKILVAHEDEHRPQKQRFIKNTEYRIRKNKYNPELARYWIENNPDFVRRDPKNGDLIVTYDFSTFGIPIEPFKDDPFTPDLRIVSEAIAYNSTRGQKYTGEFILIEIFGATGFTYNWKVSDERTGCTRPPQTLKQMVDEWIHRRRIFNISSGRMRRFPHPDGYEGSPGFNPENVYKHLNIWNRVNYISCKDTKEFDAEIEEIRNIDDEDGAESPLSKDEREELVKKVTKRYKKTFSDYLRQEPKYEIMNNSGLNTRASLHCDGGKDCNTISWNSKDRPEVFIFLAVAVDKHYSLCNYHTLFAVTLPKAQELDDRLSFLCFVSFTCVWVAVIVVGYWWRKSQIRQKYVEDARTDRLKQTAWTVIYQYEKLLHENENKELESEIEEFSKLMQENDKEREAKIQNKQPQEQPKKAEVKKSLGDNGGMKKHP